MKMCAARRIGRARIAVVTMSSVIVTALSGCVSSDAGSSESGDASKFGLVTQLSMGDYFAAEAEGAKAKAEQLGIDLEVVDAGQDPAQQISMSQSMVTSGVDGLAVVPSNTDVGPRIASLTERADIPLVASDSPLEDSDGDAVPFVGLDQEASGAKVGDLLSREYAAKGWSDGDTYYAVIEAPELQVCNLRTDASSDAFLEANPDFSEDHVVEISYDGTPAAATTSMQAAITANPEAEHWLISSCNDDGVVGALRALEAKGFDAPDNLGVGLGGNLACQAYSTPYIAQGMPVSTYLDPGAIGAKVVQTMYDLAKGKSVEDNVYVPTPEIGPDNYSDVVGCK